MKKLLSAKFVFALLFILIYGNIYSQHNNVNEWTQFRGKYRTGISDEQLSHTVQAELVWKNEIGNGYSEMLISGGKAFTMFSEMTDSVSGFDVLAAYDASNGSLLWKLNVDSMYFEVDGWGHGPRSTPAVDDEHVYCLSGNGTLAAYALENGKQMWSHNLTKEFGSVRPRWGYATSPIIIGDKLFLETGGTEERGYTAFNKKTGEVIWQKGITRSGYNSPLLTTINGQEQLICIGGRNVQSFTIDGDTIWSYTLPIAGPIVMPLVFETDKIFFSSIHSGDVTVQINNGKVKEIRKGFTMKNDYATGIYYKGHIYGFHIASFRCIDAETGEVKWSKRGFGKGNFIMVGDKFIILSDKGNISIAKANPEIYEEITSFQAVEASRSWTAPSFVNGMLYVRNHKETACWKLK